jgi:hypothetical protein
MLVSGLTPGERLYLTRLRAKQSVKARADEMHVDVKIYRAWQEDEGDDIPIVPMDEVLPREFYIIVRRRCGFAIRQLASVSGLEESIIQSEENGRRPLFHLPRFWSGQPFMPKKRCAKSI